MEAHQRTILLKITNTLFIIASVHVYWRNKELLYVWKQWKKKLKYGTEIFVSTQLSFHYGERNVSVNIQRHELIKIRFQILNK